MNVYLCCCWSLALVVAGLQLVSAIVDEDLVREYRKEKAAEGSEFLADADRIVEKLVALRQQQSPSQDGIHQLVYEKPYNPADVPFLMNELQLRAQQDPEMVGQSSRNQLLRRYIVDPCKYYSYLYQDYFKKAETSDFQLKSYSVDPSKADFYHDFATYKVCEALIQWIHQL